MISVLTLRNAALFPPILSTMAGCRVGESLCVNERGEQESRQACSRRQHHK